MSVRPSYHASDAFAWLRAAVFSIVVATAAGAAEDDQVIFPASATRADAPASARSGGLNTVTLVLGVMLAAAGGWMVWRHRRGAPVGRDARLLAVDETRSLGNRQFLVVASYEGKKFLLGVCPGRIDLLSALPASSGRKEADE